MTEGPSASVASERTLGRFDGSVDPSTLKSAYRFSEIRLDRGSMGALRESLVE